MNTLRNIFKNACAALLLPAQLLRYALMLLHSLLSDKADLTARVSVRGLSNYWLAEQFPPESQSG